MTDELIVSQRARDAAARLEDELGFLTELEMPIVRQFLAQFEADTLASQARQIEALRSVMGAVSSAISRARDLVPDDDEGPLADVFAKHLNYAQSQIIRALNPARTTLEETSRG